MASIGTPAATEITTSERPSPRRDGGEDAIDDLRLDGDDEDVGPLAERLVVLGGLDAVAPAEKREPLALEIARADLLRAHGAPWTRPRMSASAMFPPPRNPILRPRSRPSSLAIARLASRRRTLTALQERAAQISTDTAVRLRAAVDGQAGAGPGARQGPRRALLSAGLRRCWCGGITQRRSHVRRWQDGDLSIKPIQEISLRFKRFLSFARFGPRFLAHGSGAGPRRLRSTGPRRAAFHPGRCPRRKPRRRRWRPWTLPPATAPKMPATFDVAAPSRAGQADGRQHHDDA